MTALPPTSLQDLEFEFVEQPRPSLLLRNKNQRRAAVTFASVTMQQAPPSRGKAPAFTIASALEARPASLEGVPQWRITAGNLAAGATAGCSVEAGGFANHSNDSGVRWCRPGLPPHCKPDQPTQWSPFDAQPFIRSTPSRRGCKP